MTEGRKLTGRDRMGNLNLRFVIFDLKAAAHKSKIKNQKSKISHPAHPVYSC
jgi:hypothetical protein